MFQVYGVIIFLSKIYWLHQLKIPLRKPTKIVTARSNKTLLVKKPVDNLGEGIKFLTTTLKNGNCYFVEKHVYFHSLLFCLNVIFVKIMKYDFFFLKGSSTMQVRPSFHTKLLVKHSVQNIVQ